MSRADQMDTRIGCSTITFRGLGLLEALQAIAAQGFDEVDLCIIPGVCPHVDLAGYGEADVERIREQLGRLNLSVVALNVIAGYLNLSNAEQVAGLLQRAVDLAAGLGARAVTIPSGAQVDPARWRKAVALVGARLTRLADHASERNVEISVEAPHRATLVGTVEEAARFLDALADPRIKCTFDTSHVASTGSASLVEGLQQIGVERINHVHLRDAVGTNIMVTPGRGRADFRGCIDELRRHDYRGSLSLELEFRTASHEQVLAEVTFARRYVQGIIDGSKPGLGQRIAMLPPVSLLRRLWINPVEEVKRSPRLAAMARWLQAQAPSLLPARTYAGRWRRRWSFPRRFVTHRRRRFPLEVAPTSPVRVCIAGSGYAGTNHAFGFRRLAGVELAGVSDLSPQRSAALGRRAGCRAYSSSQEMIEKEKPDVVSVCTREWQHYEIVKDCLEAGIDVFCEKLLTPRFEEAQELLMLARQQQRVLAMNYNYRFMPGIRKMREALRSGSFGELVLANVKVHGHAYHHALDLVSFLAGQVIGVRASYVNDDALRPFGHTDWRLWDPDILYVPSQSLAAILELKGGSRFAITSSCLADPRQFLLSVDMQCREGAISLSGLNQFDVVGRLTWTGGRNVARGSMEHRRGVFARGFEYTFYKSIESFMNAYTRERTAETPGVTGLSVMRLEKAISESNSTGRRVAFDDAS